MYLLFGMYYLLQKNLYLSLCKKINVIIAKKPNDNVAERENEKNTVHVPTWHLAYFDISRASFHFCYHLLQ